MNTTNNESKIFLYAILLRCIRISPRICENQLQTCTHGFPILSLWEQSEEEKFNPGNVYITTIVRVEVTLPHTRDDFSIICDQHIPINFGRPHAKESCRLFLRETKQKPWQNVEKKAVLGKSAHSSWKRDTEKIERKKEQPLCKWRLFLFPDSIMRR